MATLAVCMEGGEEEMEGQSPPSMTIHQIVSGGCVGIEINNVKVDVCCGGGSKVSPWREVAWWKAARDSLSECTGGGGRAGGLS